MENNSIVMLAGKGESTNIVYNLLKDNFQIEKVILEEAVPRVQFLKRRAKRYGYSKVCGQVLFQSIAVPFLNRASRRRAGEIRKQFGLNAAPIEEQHIARVDSVNSVETEQMLKRLAPRVVVVNGTRIISDRILNCFPAQFINMHAGITPAYRGVHGGYWSLAEGDRVRCGVTVHLVDAGIDTGRVIGQTMITPTEQDNFTTYPLLQLAAGLPLLKKAVADALEDRIETQDTSAGGSKLWSHPTLLEYVRHRVSGRVK